MATDPIELVFSLIGYPEETEWIEFKSNNDEPHRLAQDISALANATAYHDHEYAYKLWGVEGSTHRLVGTSFNPPDAQGRGKPEPSSVAQGCAPQCNLRVYSR